MTKKYPNLVIDMKKILNNSKIIVKLCKDNGVDIACVVKGFNGIVEVAEQMSKSGCKQIASSRINQLKDLKSKNIDIETLLLRIPMFSEINETIRYADISLNSQIETLEKLNEAALKSNIKHKVILMKDLGDLREGIFNKDEFIKLAFYVETEFKGLILEGIGSNLSCYGSIIPTEKNLNELVECAESIEKLINRKLKYISGGATTTLPLLNRGKLPKRINHLRVGESIICAQDLPLYWDTNIEGLEKGTFVIETQIIEIQRKPSYPLGEKCVNAFGESPEYLDKGLRLRAITALGNRDVGSYTSLIPLDEGVELVGASSDHLILDIENSTEKYSIGDVLCFEMYYQGVLFASDRNLVNLEFKY